MAKIKAKKMQKKKGSNTKFLVVIALVVLAGIAYAVNSGGPSGAGASGDVMTLAEARIAIDEEYVKKGLSPTDTAQVRDGYTPILTPRLVDDNLKLPSYAYTNALTLKAYKFATEHPEVLEQIPCYCNCGMMGHRFLRDCFIHDDGTYEEHASFCDICVGETLKVQNYVGLN